MKSVWQIHETKNRFSEFIKTILEDPQTLTHHGKPVVKIKLDKIGSNADAASTPMQPPFESISSPSKLIKPSRENGPFILFECRSPVALPPGLTPR